MLRKREGRLPTTKAGQALLKEERASELHACLVEAIFWRLNLAYFDHVSIETWPQNHVGVVLWCLSMAGQDWFMPADLVRACTIWDPLNGKMGWLRRPSRCHGSCMASASSLECA